MRHKRYFNDISEKVRVSLATDCSWFT